MTSPAPSGVVLAVSFVLVLAPLLFGLAQLRQVIPMLDGVVAYSVMAPIAAMIAAVCGRALATMFAGHEVRIGLFAAIGLSALFLCVVWTPAIIGLVRSAAPVSVWAPGMIGSLLYQLPALLLFTLGASLLFGAKETAST